MPVHVEFSNCGNPEIEASVRRRCLDIFKNVPEDWMVAITASDDKSDWNMTIHGPSNFSYGLNLGDVAEHNPDFIVTAIKQAIIGETSG